MPREQSRNVRTPSFFLGKIRDILLHRGIHLELAALDQQSQTGGGERFGDAADAEARRGRDRGFGFQISKTKSLRPNNRAIDRHGGGQAGNFGRNFF